MQLPPGTRLGRYELTGLLGAGEMGEVYRAHDERLGREVAIKVLPEEVSQDRSRVLRFEHEARAAAALNHPAILAVHDFGLHEGRSYLVTELLEGETLAQRLRQGPLPLDRLLDYALQVARGVAAAHGKGIAHRDLKPENLFITTDGRVKILDFGVAKLIEPDVAAPADGPLPTAATAATATALTDIGARVGTPGYMSPEQVRGEPADARSDVFALGTVLYEMAAGQRAFGGKSGADRLAAVLRDEPPPLGSSASGVARPPALERVIRRCLQKSPADRYQSGREVALALEEIAAGAAPRRESRTPRPTAPRRRRLVAGLALLVSLAALVGVGAWLVLPTVRGWLNARGADTAPAITSLAVLPLKNYSGDTSQDYFVDGTTDALIAGLAQIKALKVISRTSVMQYKDSKKPLPEIAKELGVDGIVEGSVMRSGDRVRVTAQLIDAHEDRHLWAGNYERELKDVLALQSELIRAIVGEIRAQVTPQEQVLLAASRTVDPAVYDVTLKATTALEHATTEPEFRRAMDLFQAAVDRDPTYAPAWAGLAWATWSLATMGFEYVAPGDVRETAIAAAEKALALDETLPESHLARGIIAAEGEWDLAAAQRHYERALELRPGYAAAHMSLCQLFQTWLGRFDEARRHLDRALELDPFSPWNEVNLVGWWGFQGEHARALEEARRARQRDATLWIIPWGMGFSHLSLEQPQQAAKRFEEALMLQPGRPAAVLGPLGLAYGLAGRRDEARRILEELESAARTRYVSPVFIALVASGLGEMDKAYRLLERGLEIRAPWLGAFILDSDSTNVAVRKDPRWPEFARRVAAVIRLPEGTPPLVP